MPGQGDLKVARSAGLRDHGTSLHAQLNPEFYGDLVGWLRDIFELLKG